MELGNTSAVSLIKGAVRDFKKLIKRENQRIAKEDYTDVPDSRYYDRGFVQGMISAKIFFERYYKRYLHVQDEIPTERPKGFSVNIPVQINQKFWAYQNFETLPVKVTAIHLSAESTRFDVEYCGTASAWQGWRLESLEERDIGNQVFVCQEMAARIGLRIKLSQKDN